MYRTPGLPLVHATGLPYRERRISMLGSRFSNLARTRPHRATSGWLDRALAVGGRRGMALQTAVPLCCAALASRHLGALGAARSVGGHGGAGAAHVRQPMPRSPRRSSAPRALRAEPMMNDAIEANAMPAAWRPAAVALARRR